MVQWQVTTALIEGMTHTLNLLELDLYAYLGLHQIIWFHIRPTDRELLSEQNIYNSMLPFSTILYYFLNYHDSTGPPIS